MHIFTAPSPLHARTMAVMQPNYFCRFCPHPYLILSNKSLRNTLRNHPLVYFNDITWILLYTEVGFSQFVSFLRFSRSLVISMSFYCIPFIKRYHVPIYIDRFVSIHRETPTAHLSLHHCYWSVLYRTVHLSVIILCLDLVTNQFEFYFPSTADIYSSFFTVSYCSTKKRSVPFLQPTAIWPNYFTA